MQVIPGIDLMDGKCCCPMQTSFGQDTQNPRDPEYVASKWAQQGAKRLFIADLEGARMGKPQNLEAVKNIIEMTKLPIDFGGGIRSLDTAKRLLDMGVDRIVVGTSAALEESFAREIFGCFGDRTILSLASLNGYVAVRDWQARTDERADDFAKRMHGLGATRLVFTDVSRKGTSGGVNVTSIARMARTLQIPVIASGGVSNLEDIERLKLFEPIGIEGVIVVTAIYSGSLNLSEAISIADVSE